VWYRGLAEVRMSAIMLLLILLVPHPFSQIEQEEEEDEQEQGQWVGQRLAVARVATNQAALRRSPMRGKFLIPEPP
jgi:hypothetical protein